MIPEVKKRIAKGRRSLAAAARLLRDGDPDFAVSRAYYGMFYLAEAALLSRGLSFSKHSGVIAGFGQHFVRTGLVSQESFASLRHGSEERNRGDYGFTQPVTEEDATMVLRRATSFVDEVAKLLQDS